MLVITGWNSRIAEELRELLDEPRDFDRAKENYYNIVRATYDKIPLNADRYFFCAGYLLPKCLKEMTRDEVVMTYDMNLNRPVEACDSIFAVNPKARICLMGSESGYSGSYNEPYANAKSLLHAYVETRQLSPDQQLVAVSPGIISDAGMTTRRLDQDVLERRREEHPKKRFVTSLEVAKLVRFLLYEDQGYITNTVIRMHGGARV